MGNVFINKINFIHNLRILFYEKTFYILKVESLSFTQL